MLADSAEVLHEPVKFFKRRPALAFNRFSDEPEFLDDGKGVVERLSR